MAITVHFAATLERSIMLPALQIRRADPAAARILSTALPAPSDARGAVERLPVLAAPDGLPYRLPVRWVVRQRRWSRAEKTIRDNLAAIRLLYGWLAHRFGMNPDDLLEDGFILPAQHRDRARSVEALVRYLDALRDGQAPLGVKVSQTFLAVQSHTIRDFLVWAADPLVRGGRAPTPTGEVQAYQQLLSARLKDFTDTIPVESERVEPLTPDQDRALRELIEPVRRSDGHFEYPLHFSDSNPFHASTRLRNWLMYLVARDYGARRGEVLTLHVTDIASGSGGSTLAIRRRPNAHDPRREKPSVKRRGRDVPVAVGFLSASRVYLTGRLPEGRRGAKTPYLFVTKEGEPMALTTADRMLWVPERRLGWPRGTLSWHTLRHTWAEELATDLLAQRRERPTKGRDQEEQSTTGFREIEVLRKLGGWSERSHEPSYYIQNALHADAARYFRERQERLWDRPAVPALDEAELGF